MNAANLTQAHALYLATHEVGWSASERATAEAIYRRFAVAIAKGLPFPYHLARVASSDHTTMPPDVHIVCDKKVALGHLLRLSGDTLCRPWIRFPACSVTNAPTKKARRAICASGSPRRTALSSFRTGHLRSAGRSLYCHACTSSFC